MQIPETFIASKLAPTFTFRRAWLSPCGSELARDDGASMDAYALMPAEASIFTGNAPQSPRSGGGLGLGCRGHGRAGRSVRALALDRLGLDAQARE